MQGSGETRRLPVLLLAANAGGMLLLGAGIALLLAPDLQPLPSGPAAAYALSGAGLLIELATAVLFVRRIAKAPHRTAR